MFEYWNDGFSSSLRRVVDPPLPVLVDLGMAIPTHGASFRAEAVTMRVKAGGLHVAGSVPGLLYAWARTTDGSWLGLVGFAIGTGNRKGRVEVRQWCAAQALSRSDGRRHRGR
ncbi:hypothetical protein [Nocardia bovistercoris]|uniref:Uncharacterized protein n=1 Tax=Nocardia bovistercoris TaxID=2785916 RepID=A0A931IAZ5_9NOCA|nr:hypothetical protein [Nocardia bovistercoris]MBH0776560.1 hypothetical protein [Nocardia bovistercoris]